MRHIRIYPYIVRRGYSESPKDLTSLFVQVAQQLHRPPESVTPYLDKLKAEWIETIEDFDSIDIPTLQSLGIPLKLITSCKQLLSEGHIPTTPPPIEVPSPTAPPPIPAPVEEEEVDRAPKMRLGRGSAYQKKVTNITIDRVPYGLRPEEVSPGLARELQQFHHFLTNDFYGQQELRVSTTTADKYVDRVKHILGWMVRMKPKVERGSNQPSLTSQQKQQKEYELEYQYRSVRIGELKALLRQRKLSVTGNKDILAKRLAESDIDEMGGGEGIEEEGGGETTAEEQRKILKRLSLRDIIPSKEREDIKNVFEYLTWLSKERQCSPSTENNVVHAMVQVAKFLYHKESTAEPSEGDKPYHDILVIRELRKLQNDTAKRSRRAQPVSDEQAKWMEWDEYLDCVEYLRKECAERTHGGKARSPSAIAHSYQIYLMFSILSCVPDRQRTLRELSIGKTLVKQTGEDGEVQWVIKHGPEDYKTGKVYGERPPLIISSHIAPYLEVYLSKWRHYLAPKHDFVFSMKNGKPVNGKWIYQTFSNAAFRITGKKTNPHLVRDMIVTHIRNTDASEKELEALALYMGHSLRTQSQSYDKRSKLQKVAPAIEAMKKLSFYRKGGRSWP